MVTGSVEHINLLLRCIIRNRFGFNNTQNFVYSGHQWLTRANMPTKPSVTWSCNVTTILSDSVHGWCLFYNKYITNINHVHRRSKWYIVVSCFTRQCCGRSLMYYHILGVLGLCALVLNPRWHFVLFFASSLLGTANRCDYSRCTSFMLTAT